ncbi:HdeD family acid-resistance protein [Tsukamurella ocularis]|uniref:HdeD family acid-resistance protein n=1 Tax=Tsukamurella ocularis TaxID=1970234 RepID=UPI0039EEE148
MSTYPNGPADTGHSIIGDVRGFAADVAQRTWQSAIAIGAIAAILGIVLLAWPQPTLHVVAILFALYLLITGVLQVVATFGVLSSQSFWWRLLTFLSGAISIVLAVVAFRDVVESLVLLAIWIGVGWIFRGIASLSLYNDFPKGAPGKVWGIILGILSVVAGAFVVIYPYDSIPSLVLATGIVLIALGLVEIFHGIQIRSTINRIRPQV